MDRKMFVVIPLNCSKPFLKLRIPSTHQTGILSSINYGARTGNRPRNLSISVNETARPRTQKQGRRCSIVSELDTDPHQDDKRDGEEESLGVKAALSMLTFYKREISPLLPKSCRYVPSCSEYSMIAYKKYGVVKGTVLTAWRLCRCNPLGGSGFDPPRWFNEEAPSEE